MGMTAEAREADLIRTYIDAHDLAAITVVERDGCGLIAVSTPFRWDADYAGIWWLADPSAAAALVAGIPQGLQIDDAIRLVQVGAERARIRLTDHATLIARGRGAVALVEQRLRNMQASGDMRGLNVEYQDHRLFNKEHGRGVKPYWSWLHDRKIEMVKAVALTASGKRPHNPDPPERLNSIAPRQRRRGQMKSLRVDGARLP